MLDDKKAVLANASDDTGHEFSFYLRDLSTGQLHITRSGLERYGARYARIGVDLRTVRTEADAEAAWQAGLRHDIRDFAREAKGAVPNWIGFSAPCRGGKSRTSLRRQPPCRTASALVLAERLLPA